MATTSPLRQRMIDDMRVRNFSASDAAILHPRGFEVQLLSAGLSRNGEDAVTARSGAGQLPQWLHARAIAIGIAIIIWKCDPNFILWLSFSKYHLIGKGGCHILISLTLKELSS